MPSATTKETNKNWLLKSWSSNKGGTELCLLQACSPIFAPNDEDVYHALTPEQVVALHEQ